MKSILLKFWPLFCIFTLWFLFSAPFFLQGKIPFAGDYQTTFFSPWSDYKEFAQPVKNNAMPDIIDQLYPWKHLVISDWKNGEIPLWNPYQFAGTPLLANYQSAVFSPMNLLFFLFPFKIAWGILILLQPLLAGVGMYFFVKKIGVSKIGATLSSFSFMFCSFIVTWMGYGTLSYAVAVLPLVLVGLEGYLQQKQFRYILLMVFALFFSFMSGHFQMSLYVLSAAFLHFLFRYIPANNKKIFLYGLGGILIGVLLAAPQIFPSIAFYGQSLRSTIFQRPEIIPWQYLFTVIAPDFFGNPVTRNDWFGHYAEWGSYVGVLPFLFALFSFQEVRKNKFVLFFSCLGIVSLLLATPTFLGDLILQLHIPVLATSAAGRIIILFSFSLAVLSGFGIDMWMHASAKRKLFLGIFSFIFLFIGWIIIFGKIGLSVEHILIAKQNFLLPSIVLIGAVVGCFITFFLRSKKIAIFLSIVFLLITAFDMYRFASKWQSFSSQNLVFPDVGVTKFFQNIKNERSLGNYGGQVSLYYQLPSIEGYDALYPERFGTFSNYVANGSLQPASRSVVDFPKNGKYTAEAVNLLGVKYIIHKISDTNKPWTFPVWQYPKDFTIVYQDSSYLIFKNTKAFPRAFVAADYIVQSDSQKNLSALFAPTTDPLKTLVLEKDPHIVKIGSLAAQATIDLYTANKISVTTVSNVKALLFLSDTYFPGWHAYVDGKETPIYRADYTFRSVVVPAGKHTVVFVYLPSSLVYGILGTAAGILLLITLYFFQKKRV